MFFGWEKVEPNQVLNHLSDLKEFFKDKSKWAYWPNAMDGYGSMVDVFSEKAQKWSLIGASELIISAKYPKPICDFIDCATRDFIKSMTDGELPQTYEEEYAAICEAFDKLSGDLF